MAQQLPTLDGTSNLSSIWRTMVNQARAFMRDYAKLNLLLEEEETGDRTLLMDLALAVSDVNGEPPNTAFSLEELVNAGYTTIILYGTLVHVLEGLMLLETRNHLNWQDGGNVVGLQDKTPLLAQHVRYYRDLYGVKLSRKKISHNIATAVGSQLMGVPSEYWAIHGYLWDA